MTATFFVGGNNKRAARVLLEEAEKTILEQGATIKGLQLAVGRLESKLAKQAEEIGALKAEEKTVKKRTTFRKTDD